MSDGDYFEDDNLLEGIDLENIELQYSNKSFEQNKPKKVHISEFVQTKFQEPKPLQDCLPSKHEINEEYQKKWIYPTNLPIREYQFNISQAALYRNTLVSLPTGLGKTFIAAVVIYNFFRWFPKGKIIFLAPTKPLVNQQIEACYKITGISRDNTCELTGTVSMPVRRSQWLAKRLFFMTPETLRNDMETGCCPVDDIVLIVFDEAHRASGNYAYVEIINMMKREQTVFRVLALSATPGTDTSKVQQVVDNLLIQKLMLRTEEAVDVAPYVHNREVVEIVVGPSEEMKELVAEFGKIIVPFLKKLVDVKAFHQENPLMVQQYSLVARRNAWRHSKGNLPRGMQSMIEAYFAISISLITFLQKLMGWGIRSFHEELVAFDLQVKQKSNPSTLRLNVAKSAGFVNILQKTKELITKSDLVSHPKIEKLVEIVLEHFKNHEVKVKNAVAEETQVLGDTRIMIFALYRSSVDEIVKVLSKYPDIRPAAFIGQSNGSKMNTGKKTRNGLKQREQLEVIADFQSGKYNVLCATSIGEEGLDIGDIDAIICFDVNKSPIRMLQRSGRTGRKRKGVIYLLMSQGADEMSVKKARAQYKSVQKSIQSSKIKTYDGYLAGIINTTGIECEKKHFYIEDDTIQTVPKKRSSKKSTDSKKENGLMDPERAIKYYDTYFKSAPNISISLNAHSHWQTTELPVLKTPHGSKSRLFTALMSYFENLKEKESILDSSSIQPIFNSHEPIEVSNTQKEIKPGKRRRVSTANRVLLSDDSRLSWTGGKDTELSEDENRNIETKTVNRFEVAENPLSNQENKIFEKGDSKLPNADIEFGSALDDDFDNFNIDYVDETTDNIQTMGHASADYSIIKGTPAPLLVSESFEFDFKDSPVNNKIPISDKKGSLFNESTENVQVASSDYGSFNDDFDIAALKQLESVEIEHFKVPVSPITIVDSQTEGSPNIVVAPKRSKRLIVRSSSNAGSSPMAPKFQSPLRFARTVRRPPKDRPEPIFDMPSTKYPPKKKRIYNQIAKDYVEIEAEVSGSDVSSDEIVNETANDSLSGFIVNESPISQSYDRNVYRRPEPIGKYRFAAGYEPGKNLKFRGSDGADSLDGFIVEDENISYQTQNPNDPLLFDELSQITVEHGADEDLIDNDIDLDSIIDLSAENIIPQGKSNTIDKENDEIINLSSLIDFE